MFVSLHPPDSLPAGAFLKRVMRYTTVFSLLLMVTSSLLAGGFGPNHVVSVAHRGGIVQGCPENTLNTYRKAIEAGLQVIEIDLRGTSDDGIVIMHDETVDRTTNGCGRVGELTLADLKQLDAGNGERIPEYREVLECVSGSGVLLLLDIKESSRLDLRKVVELTESYNAVLKVIVGARKVEDVRLFKQLNPNLRVLALMPNPGDAGAFLDAGADIIRIWPEWLAQEPELVSSIHARGHAVWLTAGKSDEAALRTFTGKGIDGILSDYPVLLRKVVESPDALSTNHPNMER